MTEQHNPAPEKSADPIRRFELYFLRPVWGAIILFTAIAAFNSRWWWVGGGILALMYIGVIGAKLHPSLTAHELSQGPLTGSATVKELGALSDTEKRILVTQACNRVGHLAAVALAVYFLAVLGWRWYIGLPVAFFGSAFFAGILRVALAER